MKYIIGLFAFTMWCLFATNTAHAQSKPSRDREIIYVSHCPSCALPYGIIFHNGQDWVAGFSSRPVNQSTRFDLSCPDGIGGIIDFDLSMNWVECDGPGRLNVLGSSSLSAFELGTVSGPVYNGQDFHMTASYRFSVLDPEAVSEQNSTDVSTSLQSESTQEQTAGNGADDFDEMKHALEELQSLYEDGLISEEEYDQMRKVALGL